MSDDELRAAAERLLHGNSYDYCASDARRKEAIGRDAHAVARACLAEHPADDGEPAIWPWLGTAGFADHGPELSSLLRSGPWRVEICGGTGGTTLWLNGCPVCDMPTRGDVRRLLAALGIPAGG